MRCEHYIWYPRFYLYGWKYDRVSSSRCKNPPLVVWVDQRATILEDGTKMNASF